MTDHIEHRIGQPSLVIHPTKCVCGSFRYHLWNWALYCEDCGMRGPELTVAEQERMRE